MLSAETISYIAVEIFESVNLYVALILSSASTSGGPARIGPSAGAVGVLPGLRISSRLPRSPLFVFLISAVTAVVAACTYPSFSKLVHLIVSNFS